MYIYMLLIKLVALPENKG